MTMRRVLRTVPFVLCLAPLYASSPAMRPEGPASRGVQSLAPLPNQRPPFPTRAGSRTLLVGSGNRPSYGEASSPSPPSSAGGGKIEEEGKRSGASGEGVAQARIAVGSDSGGLGMDLDVDVEKLKGALGKVAGPLVVLLNVVQASIFYAAPMLALVQFLKELRKPRKQRSLPAGGHDARTSHPYVRRSGYATSGGQYPGPTGEESVLVSAGTSKEGLDWEVLSDLTRRVLSQFVTLTAILSVVGVFVKWGSGSGGFLTSKPLITTIDAVTAACAIFASDQLPFLRFKMDMHWYLNVLKKPSWTPPPIAFPLIWTPLKIMQTIGFVLVWQAVQHQALTAPVLLFVLHLCLGDLWNMVFFGQRRVGFGLTVIWTFYAALAASCYAFLTVSPAAGYLLMPTAVWVFIAVSLQFSIWLLQGQEPFLPIKGGFSSRKARPVPPLVVNV